MKKRVLIAIALVIALVLIAQTGVWAGKLFAGNEAPVAAPGEAGARPAGTDETSNFVPIGPNSVLPYVPPAGGPAVPSCFMVKDVAEVCPLDESNEAALIEDATSYPEGLNGETVAVISIEGGRAKVCFASEEAGTVLYYDGSDWQELTTTQDGANYCAIVPDNAEYVAFVK